MQVIQKTATSAIQAFLLLPSSQLCKSRFSVQLEIKSKLRKIQEHIFVVLSVIFHLISMTMNLLPKSRLIHIVVDRLLAYLDYIVAGL